jgi:hypothetical protein
LKSDRPSLVWNDPEPESDDERAERAESDRDVNARCVHGGDEWRACLAMAAAAATRGDDGVETTTPQ